MCARYSNASPYRKIVTRFGVDAEDGAELAPRFNIAPSQEAPVVVADRDGRRHMRLMRWGLVPCWAKDTKDAGKAINARAESLAGRPTFKEPFERRRCLVPADGFYEWRDAGRAGKIPLRYVMKDGEPFGFAGLWDAWRAPGGKRIETFSIVTTPPNDLVRPIHDRMPAILRRDDEARWLDTKVSDPEWLAPLLRPYQADAMRCFEVSRAINSASVEGADLVEPVRDLFDR